MDPELLSAVKALVAQGGGSGSGTGSLVVLSVIILAGLIAWAERRIRPPVVEACDTLKRREREQSVTLRLLAGKAGISIDDIQRGLVEEELRERRPPVFMSFEASPSPGLWPLNGAAAPSPATAPPPPATAGGAT